MLLNATREQAGWLARTISKLDSRMDLLMFNDALMDEDLTLSVRAAVPYSYWRGWPTQQPFKNGEGYRYDDVADGGIGEYEGDVVMMDYSRFSELDNDQVDNIVKNHKLVVIGAPASIDPADVGGVISLIGRPLHLNRSDDRVLYVFRGGR